MFFEPSSMQQNLITARVPPRTPLRELTALKTPLRKPLALPKPL